MFVMPSLTVVGGCFCLMLVEIWSFSVRNSGTLK